MFDEDELEELDLIFNSADKWAEVFPEPKEAQKMLERYAMIVINEIDDVKESKEELEIEGVKQTCTALTVKIDEKLVKNITTSLCKEAVNDKELENLVTRAVDMYIETGTAPYYYNAYYGDGAGYWDNLEEQLDWIADNAKNLDFYGWKYEVKLFVSGTGKVQGFDFTKKNNDRDMKGRVYAAYTRSGSKMAVTYIYEHSGSWSDEHVEITGEGKVSFGRMNAEFEVKASGSDKVSFRVENLKLANLVRGQIEGDLLMDLKQFRDELEREDLSELKSQTLKIHVLMDEKNLKYEISLNEGKDVFASYATSAKIGRAGSISIPSDSKCELIDNEEDLMDYIDDCDFNGLADTLDDLGMPDDIINAIENGGGLPRYISKSRVSADTQLADSIHTAVLTAMMDPEIVNREDYNDAFYELMQGIDITSYTGDENGILQGAAEILGVEDLHELSGQIKSSGATGRIWVTAIESYRIEVVIEGTDCGNGDEITVK